jgi:hypothetical protein
MRSDFKGRVSAVDWSSYSHPCLEDQSRIPKLLFRMRRGPVWWRRKAAEKLWNIAAHQGNVGPSALPAAGFLIEMLEEMPSSVQVEALDTLYQFSNSCTGKPWGAELRALFLEALPIFTRLSTDANEDVADFSRMIIENIETDE